jgi:hypothetical protein
LRVRLGEAFDREGRALARDPRSLVAGLHVSEVLEQQGELATARVEVAPVTAGDAQVQPVRDGLVEADLALVESEAPCARVVDRGSRRQFQDQGTRVRRAAVVVAQPQADDFPEHARFCLERLRFHGRDASGHGRCRFL